MADFLVNFLVPRRPYTRCKASKRKRKERQPLHWRLLLTRGWGVRIRGDVHPGRAEVKERATTKEKAFPGGIHQLRVSLRKGPAGRVGQPIAINNKGANKTVAVATSKIGGTKTEGIGAKGIISNQDTNSKEAAIRTTSDAKAKEAVVRIISNWDTNNEAAVRIGSSRDISNKKVAEAISNRDTNRDTNTKEAAFRITSNQDTDNK
jgi:hypothetical protein